MICQNGSNSKIYPWLIAKAKYTPILRMFLSLNKFSVQQQFVALQNIFRLDDGVLLYK